MKHPARWSCWGVVLPPLVAFLLYWPVGTWFQGDDFLAVTYTQDWGNVAHDFVGPQYSLTGHTLFWRPLITLSFALESRLFGGTPFWFHLDNALCHGLNTLLLLLVLRRLLDRAWASRAALLWGLHPVGAFSVMWVVGRVDVHVTCWILLGTLFALRRAEGRGGLVLSLLAGLAALGTKELGLVLAPVAALALYFASREGTPGERVRGALRGSAHLFALVPLYLVGRGVLLGEFMGGYKAESFQPLEAVKGLFLWAGRLLTPVATGMGEVVVGRWALPLAWAGGLVLVLLLALTLRRRAGRQQGLAGIAFALLFYGGTCVPLFHFLSRHDSPLHIRLFYLPLAGIMVLAAGGGRVATLLALVLMVPAHLTVRTDFARAYHYTRTVHQELLSHQHRLDPHQPLVVTDREPDPGYSFRLRLGLDRMLLPPFATGTPPIMRWRSIGQLRPLRLSPRNSGLPLPQLLELRPDGTGELTALPGAVLPRFALVAGDLELLDYDRLEKIALAPPGSFTLRPEPAAPGNQPYRVIILTNQYYLVCRISSLPGGSLSLRQILLAKVTVGGQSPPLFTYLGLALDMAPRAHQQAWLLAARLDPATDKPVAVSRQPLRLAFDNSAVRFFMGLPE